MVGGTAGDIAGDKIATGSEAAVTAETAACSFDAAALPVPRTRSLIAERSPRREGGVFAELDEATRCGEATSPVGVALMAMTTGVEAPAASVKRSCVCCMPDSMEAGLTHGSRACCSAVRCGRLPPPLRLAKEPISCTQISPSATGGGR